MQHKQRVNQICQARYTEKSQINTCFSAQVKPIVSQYLKEKKLPYQEDGYVSRLQLFFHRYQELMVFAPPITELVGVQ